MGRGYPGRRTRGVWGRFRSIFVRVRPFENGTMIKGGTPKGAPPSHKAPQRGSFSAFGQGTHFQLTQKFRRTQSREAPLFQGIRQFFAFAEEMIEISTENVKRIVVWLKPELLSRVDGWLETANCKNRSEFISKALRFYMGYLATDDVGSYVCESVSQNIRGMLTENTNRLSKLMFKWSIELNMMMHIVAAHFKDDIGDLRALRGYSADEVKRTYGNISLDTALDIQRGNFDD